MDKFSVSIGSTKLASRGCLRVSGIAYTKRRKSSGLQLQLQIIWLATALPNNVHRDSRVRLVPITELAMTGNDWAFLGVPKTGIQATRARFCTNP